MKRREGHSAHTETHTQLLSEEEMLLGKTREPTISFPVVAAGAETLML